MFGLLRATLRAFAIGAVIGVLFAPRAGAETRKMLSERIAASLNQLLEIAALPPIQSSQVVTNGQPERTVAKRTRAAEGPGARTTT